MCRMTLGHVYDLDLKKNETLIKDVIIQAQGEVTYISIRMTFVSYRHKDGSRRICQASEGNMD